MGRNKKIEDIKSYKVKGLTPDTMNSSFWVKSENFNENLEHYNKLKKWGITAVRFADDTEKEFTVPILIWTENFRYELIQAINDYQSAPEENKITDSPPRVINQINNMTPETFQIIGSETLATKPSHYHPRVTFTEKAEIIEYVHNNILNSGQYDSKTRNRIALWAGMALKHLLRLGLKDDMIVEINKCENYCHRAQFGDWVKREGK
jgi:hypothetical protein